MNTATSPSPRFFGRSITLTILLATSACAQVIVGPALSPPSDGSEFPGDSSSSHVSLATVSSALAAGLPLIRRGPVSVRPHLQYRYAFAWNLQAVPGNLRNTSIQSITPGVLFEIGDHWQLDLVPSWTFYSDRFFTDTFSHLARLSGSTRKDTWAAGLSLSYSLSHLTLVETASQMRNKQYVITVHGSRKLGNRTWFDSSASYNARYATPVLETPGWTDSDWLQWTSTNFIRYQLTPNLSLSAGAVYGYAQVSVGDNMETVTPSARVEWRVSDKIMLSGRAGAEKRKFLSGSRGTLESPTYSGSLSYHPFQVTTVSVSATRGISASYFANEITRSQGYVVSLNQRLLSKLFLTATMSETDTEFLAVHANATPRRNDHYRTYSARLSTVVFQRAVIAAFYQIGRNLSDDALYKFRTEQVGFELNYRF
jgi:hypothetical protein